MIIDTTNLISATAETWKGLQPECTNKTLQSVLWWWTEK